jgi:hypothetical protein
MAHARPSSLVDPLDRLVGAAPALQILCARRRWGFRAFQAGGEAGLRPLSLALMAEMDERVRQVSAGLSTLDAALPLAREPGSRSDESELHRIKGSYGSRAGPVRTKPCPQAL